ncbi:universal stress protein [Robertkochia aurantiaca]|uniref:universal stress protein n=1 Tax=Robertkochia aurantiaca TaxID=2873700 RepID=UPI001CCCA866|nr:universal stress protein [Robertkochia sp. 3YJGBD-33]
MKRIVLPTDFSDNSRHAIACALDIFREEHCEFILLNVFGADVYSTANTMALQSGDAVLDAVIKRSERDLENLRQMLENKKSESHSFRTVSRYSFISEAINSLLKEERIDLVVMGTKGATGAREIWFGSNTVTVMENVTGCPVLAIPASYHYKRPGEILFPSSFEYRYREEEVEAVCELARKFKAAVRVMHISEEDVLSKEQRENKQRLMQYFEPLECSSHTLSNFEPETAIRCFVQARDIDMIALVNHKHGFFESIFRKSTVKELGYHSTVPLLVMHRKE